jgi:ParB-like chromosome segregation protein Spo0J
MVDGDEARRALFQKILSLDLSVREAESRAVKSKHERRATKRSDPSLERLSVLLSERLSARVVCSWSKRRGKITIEVSSRDELKRIIDELTRTENPI